MVQVKELQSRLAGLAKEKVQREEQHNALAAQLRAKVSTEAFLCDAVEVASVGRLIGVIARICDFSDFIDLYRRILFTLYKWKCFRKL